MIANPAASNPNDGEPKMALVKSLNLVYGKGDIVNRFTI
jgi:hypothetical protein